LCLYLIWLSNKKPENEKILQTIAKIKDKCKYTQILEALKLTLTNKYGRFRTKTGNRDAI